MPFEPFVLVSSAGRTWTIASRDCLTFDSARSTLDAMHRDESGWRESHVRVAQVVAIERTSIDLAPSDLRSTDPAE
jgi:hypothetical protein